MTINAWAVEVLDEDGYRFASIERSESAAREASKKVNAMRIIPLEDFDWEDLLKPFAI